MLVWATKDGKYGYAKLSFGKIKDLNIKLDKQPGDTASLDLDIIPPVDGSIAVTVTKEQEDANAKRLIEEDAIRNKYVSTFYTADKARTLAKELSIDSTATINYMQFKEDTYINEDDVAVKITLKGLKGGHSGVDIHLGRANANKLMFRFLKEAVRDYGARLSSIEGGSLRNAIPREAEAIVTIPGDNAESLWELISDYQDTYREEYKGIEDNISFTGEMTGLPKTLIPEEIQDDLINAIEGCQNGVLSMRQSK